MTINRVVRIIAGLFVLLSLALGVPASPVFVSEYWLWFTAFVGANLFQSGITNWCLMDMILAKLGVPATPKAPSCGATSVRQSEHRPA